MTRSTNDNNPYASTVVNDVGENDAHWAKSRISALLAASASLLLLSYIAGYILVSRLSFFTFFGRYGDFVYALVDYSVLACIFVGLVLDAKAIWSGSKRQRICASLMLIPYAPMACVLLRWIIGRII